MAEKILIGDEHVQRYRETGRKEGHDWLNGSPVLLLTTRGRQSGKPRTAPLIYATDGERYAVVASKCGSDAAPAWFLNLLQDPDVEVQVKDNVFKANARTAMPEEKAHWWPIMTAERPDYDEYQKTTDREIPIVLLGPN